MGNLSNSDKGIVMLDMVLFFSLTGPSPACKVVGNKPTQLRATTRVYGFADSGMMWVEKGITTDSSSYKVYPN